MSPISPISSSPYPAYTDQSEPSQAELMSNPQVQQMLNSIASPYQGPGAVDMSQGPGGKKDEDDEEDDDDAAES